MKEILNTNCYENLNKNFTRSLDSLLDVLTVQAKLMETDLDLEPIENVDGLTLHEKIAKLLGISLSEIINTKRSKGMFIYDKNNSAVKSVANWNNIDLFHDAPKMSLFIVFLF